MSKSTPQAKGKSADDFDFETALEALEKIVSTMESGELSLEDSLATFEKGVKLTRACQAALRQAEQRLQVLMNEDGDTEDFHAGNGAQPADDD